MSASSHGEVISYMQRHPGAPFFFLQDADGLFIGVRSGREVFVWTCEVRRESSWCEPITRNRRPTSKAKRPPSSSKPKTARGSAARAERERSGA
jgi:hypothetical protein